MSIAKLLDVLVLSTLSGAAYQVVLTLPNTFTSGLKKTTSRLLRRRLYEQVKYNHGKFW